MIINRASSGVCRRRGTRSPGSRRSPGRRSIFRLSAKVRTASFTCWTTTGRTRSIAWIRNPAAKQLHDFPRRLSQTGLFASTRDQQPARGVVPYSVNSELWADGATAERFLAVPGNGRIGLDDQGIWQFPDGSVLVRTVSLRASSRANRAAAAGWKPRSSIRRTTLGGPIRMSGTTTRPTRSWPMPQGATKTFALKTAGGSRERDSSRFRQNRVRLVPQSLGRKEDDHLRRSVGLAVGGEFTPVEQAYDRGRSQGQPAHDLSPDWDSWPGRPTCESAKLVDPYDESADLDRRARSYLQTNCSHCHQFGAGGSANIVLSYDVPLAATKTVGDRPIQGTFNIAGARIIAPAIRRARCFITASPSSEAAACPASARTRSTSCATRMIHDWIARMPKAW